MRRLLLAISAVVVVLIVADRGLALLAEHRAADHVAAKDARVTIHGVPFLTQVVDGKLDHVSVSGRDVTKDGVVIDRFAAEAYGVHTGSGGAAGGSTTSHRVDRVTGTAVITYAGLSTTIAGKAHVSIDLEPRDDRDLTARVKGPFGVTLSVPVPAPTVSGGELHVGGLLQKVVPLVPDQLADLAAIPLPTLPYGLHLASATPERDGLHLAITGTDVAVS